MNSSPMMITGYGSVSSAGLDSESLYLACKKRDEVCRSTLERQVGEHEVHCRVRPVDIAGVRKLLPKHPRLRRSSTITKFAMAATLQALEGSGQLEKMQSGQMRVGIVMSLFNGCIDYTNRFYKEVLASPQLASPLLFPETVFNAPASHIASYLGVDGPVYTLIGDTAVWFSAMQIAKDWLNLGLVDGCLVIGAEEIDWLSAEGVRLYSNQLEVTEGAAAIYMELGDAEPSRMLEQTEDVQKEKSPRIQIDTLSVPFNYVHQKERKRAIASAWDVVSSEGHQDRDKSGDTHLIIDGLTGCNRTDREEASVLSQYVESSGWHGDRMSPLKTLGYGMGVNGGFQTIAAIESLRHGYQRVRVLASGTNQHALSAQFSLVNSRM